jgi:hypothetical protein
VREQRNCAPCSGIFKHMRKRPITLPRSLAPRLLLCTAALIALAPGTALAARSAKRATHAVDPHTLLSSRLLWATIDVCNPADQPDTIGIRGSMPGDAQPHDGMYMRFRLQYMNPKSKVWTDLAKGASSTYASVGTGASARQAGRSFQLSPVPGQPAFELRGVVSFQWRRGKIIVAQASRPTTAGRESLAGSDPAGFSTATCSLS